MRWIKEHITFQVRCELFDRYWAGGLSWHMMNIVKCKCGADFENAYGFNTSKRTIINGYLSIAWTKCVVEFK